MEIDPLDSLTPGKQLPLYFVHRVSSLRCHIPRRDSRATLDSDSWVLLLRLFLALYPTLLKAPRKSSTLLSREILRTFTSNLMLGYAVSRYGKGKKKCVWLSGRQQRSPCNEGSS